MTLPIGRLFNPTYAVKHAAKSGGKASKEVLEQVAEIAINHQKGGKAWAAAGGVGLAASVPLGLAAAHILPIAAPVAAALSFVGTKAAFIPGLSTLGVKLGVLGGAGSLSNFGAAALSAGTGGLGALKTTIGGIFKNKGGHLAQAVTEVAERSGVDTVAQATKQTAEQVTEQTAKGLNKTAVTVGGAGVGGFALASLNPFGGGSKSSD
ncbi:MAG: hypothetical protein VKJ06_02565 [Vampirovibrionales bacterium]|nr:hypothetical protein [Vampirovibrionales bacterium]